MKITLISGGNRDSGNTQHVTATLHQVFSKRDGIECDTIEAESRELGLFHARHKIDSDLGGNADRVLARLQSSDAFVFISPEYNGGYAASFKNLIDLFDPSAYESKAIGVVAVSMGAMGGVRAAQQMQQLALALYGFPCPSMLLVSAVHKKWNEIGQLVDASFQPKIEEFVTDFLWLATAVHKQKR